MSKILLINPYFPVSMRLNIPIGLLHLGTYLKNNGIDVELIDCVVEADHRKRIIEGIKNASFVGISCMTTQVPHAREIALFIKNELKCAVPIIFGGVHATLYPEQVAREDYIDYVVVGEGEISTLDLLRALESGLKEAIDAVRGVAYKSGISEVRLNPKPVNFDYSRMPAFEYGLLNPMVVEAYRREGIHFPLLTSRGCPYRCMFCINVVTHNISWRAFSAERTVDEIERIMAMGFKKIWLWDENFFTSRERLTKILKIIQEKHLVFEAWAEGRVNYIKDDYLNQEMLLKLKACGFSRFGFGIESGSQKVLDYLQKDITVAQIERAARECAKAGIRMTCSFMIGLPVETREDIHQTVQLLGKIISITSTAGISGPILYRPYPGSKIYQDCVAAGWKEPMNLFEWSQKVSREFSSIPDPHKLPWVKDPFFVNFVHFYTYTLSASFKNLYLMFREFCRMTQAKAYFFYCGAMVLFMVSLVGKLRYRIRFYRFLIEKRIFRKYHPNLDY